MTLPIWRTLSDVPLRSLYYAQLPLARPFHLVATGGTHRQNEVRYNFVKYDLLTMFNKLITPIAFVYTMSSLIFESFDVSSVNVNSIQAG